MRITDDIQKCVVFIGIKNDQGAIKFSATGFLMSVTSAIPGASIFYLVTGRHVPAELAGKDFYVRVNKKDGGSVPLQVSGQFKWQFHPKEDESADVAVCPVFFQEEALALFDITTIPANLALSDDDVRQHDVGPADDVFVVGLFRFHAGASRNRPIVRTGTIAMMTDEPIATRDFGNMELHLIEMISLGGLSGSPVFVIKEAAIGEAKKYYLFGLIHGHWTINQQQIGEPLQEGRKREEWINCGIAMVVPAKKILETINCKELADARSNLEREWLSKNPPLPKA